jgi:phytoene/squalene synthetase
VTAAGCAAIVARDDPHLHATAMFAPLPARSRLMVLYAFDVELSRAAASSKEPLIARMRLQWWRDVVEAAASGAEPPAHEVARPLAEMVRRGELPAGMIEQLIASREMELEGGFDEPAFARWADARFGSLTGLAELLLAGGGAGVELAGRAGPVLGAAFALRHAAAASAQDRPLLPGLGPNDWTLLAAGKASAHAREVARRIAAEALETLKALRRDRRRIDRRALPALLPLRRAGRVLARASAPGVALHEIDDGRPFEGLQLAWAAATGRW